MAVALRPRSSQSSMVSRYGSQALAVTVSRGWRVLVADSLEFSAPESVITSLAGFAAPIGVGVWVGVARPQRPGRERQCRPPSDTR